MIAFVMVYLHLPFMLTEYNKRAVADLLGSGHCKHITPQNCMVNIPPTPGTAATELKEIPKEADFSVLLISDAHYRHYLVTVITRQFYFFLRQLKISSSFFKTM